jgi:muramoyltetrapeptide carboxypeptidase LdcA involved in peptidoglycan recycling
MPEYSEEHALKVLCRAEPVGIVEPSTWWTEEFLDWGSGEDTTRPRQRQPSPGWTWLKPGYGEGRLIGGCLESLQHLRGTRYWPEWEGALLCLETSEEAPPPETVDGMLMDYENMGVFDQINGLLFARPMRYSGEQKAQLREIILERARKYSFPVVGDMDFGHTSPIFTLPIGCRAAIDASKQRFTILEAAVS